MKDEYGQIPYVDEEPAPLFSLRGLALAALASLVACWPMVLSEAAYVYVDTASYYKAGQEIWGIALAQLEKIQPVVEVSGATARHGVSAAQAPAEQLIFDGEPRFGRSIAYSALAYPILSSVGAFGLAWAQGTLTLIALFALVTPQMLQARSLLVIGLVLLVVTTQLTWRIVYLMPDIFAATIIIFGVALTGPFDHFRRSQKIALTCLAVFAVSTHYGNIPFAVVLLGLILVWRIVTSRFAMAPAVAALITVAASPLANLGASHAVLKEPSAVPLRLPIVLARSIQDGPGAKYLNEYCGVEDWAICEAFGEDIPKSIRDFLWSDKGIRAQTPDMVQRIRDEELSLLTSILFAYPVGQSWSLASNSVLQMIRVGQGQMYAVPDFEGFLSGEERQSVEGQSLLDAFDPVINWSALVSTVLVALLLLSRMCTPADRRLVSAIFLGLLCNAIVFGGLSAPVDRYQARVVWLIPACLVMLSAACLARSREQRRLATTKTNDF